MVRREATGDSLELMLDTICNAFGGIVLITMLLAVLIRNSATSRAKEAEDALKRLTAIAEYERRAAEVQELEESVEALRRAEGNLPQQMAELAREKRELEEREREIRERIEDLAEQERRFTTQQAELQKNVEDLQKEIERKRRDLKAKTEELASVKARATFSISLPRERQRTAGGPALILRYDRVYVWHEYDSQGSRRGLNVAEFVVLSEDSQGIHVTPRPEKGIPIARENAAAIVDRLRQCRAGNDLDIGLWPDTFDTWPVFREAVVKGGFRYRVLLMGEEGRLYDRGGEENFVQ
ncbi:MAG: hypothetical protein ACUVQK_14500 [Thermogutta sp.]